MSTKKTKNSINKAYYLLAATGNFDNIQLQQLSDRLLVTATNSYMSGNDIELIISTAKLCKLLVILTNEDELKFSLISF